MEMSSFKVGRHGMLEDLKGEEETGMEASRRLGDLAKGTMASLVWTLVLMRFSISSIFDMDNKCRGTVLSCNIFPSPKPLHQFVSLCFVFFFSFHCLGLKI